MKIVGQTWDIIGAELDANEYTNVVSKIEAIGRCG